MCKGYNLRLIHLIQNLSPYRSKYHSSYFYRNSKGHRLEPLASAWIALLGSLVISCQNCQCLMCFPDIIPGTKVINIVPVSSRAAELMYSRRLCVTIQQSQSHSLQCCALPKPLYSVRVHPIRKGNIIALIPQTPQPIKNVHNAANHFKASISVHSFVPNHAVLEMDPVPAKSSRLAVLHSSIYFTSAPYTSTEELTLRSHSNLSIVSTRSKHAGVLGIPIHCSNTVFPTLTSTVSNQFLNQ